MSLCVNFFLRFGAAFSRTRRPQASAVPVVARPRTVLPTTPTTTRAAFTTLSHALLIRHLSLRAPKSSSPHTPKGSMATAGKLDAKHCSVLGKADRSINQSISLSLSCDWLSNRLRKWLTGGASRMAMAAALLVGLASWYYAVAIRPPAPTPCGSEGGPPVNAPRIRLRDGRFLAYSETGVPKEKAAYKIVFAHGFSGSRLDAPNASPVSNSPVDKYLVVNARFDLGILLSTTKSLSHDPVGKHLRHSIFGSLDHHGFVITMHLTKPNPNPNLPFPSSLSSFSADCSVLIKVDARSGREF